MSYYSQTSSLSDRLFAMLADGSKYLAARYAHYRIYSESLNELRELSDRDLNDLGLNRTMLKSIALEAADKKAPL